MTELSAIARPTGTFAMVAMDQRESLRTMLRERGREPEYDAFKTAVARVLSPHASGFLIDADHLEAVEPYVGRGLILAVDVLDQERGAIVEDTTLDEDPRLRPSVAALKLLVIWRDDERRAERVEMARRFVELARSHDLLSVLEPVVREDAQIVQAARELGAVRPSLYKCQVPTAGVASSAEITLRCREIDAALPVPWVVLSQGVAYEEFPRAVQAACAGGASGFLAGRALWTNALDADDVDAALRAQSVPRLQELCEIVDRHGRPAC